MLNETYQLYQALKTAKINYGDLHPSLKPIPSGTVLIVRLDSEGTPVNAEFVDAGERPLWNCMPDNHKRFPCLKLPPLFAVSDETKSRLKGKKIETKTKIQTFFEVARQGTLSQKCLEKLDEWKYPATLLNRYSAQILSNEPIALLLDRIEKFRIQGVALASNHKSNISNWLGL